MLKRIAFVIGILALSTQSSIPSYVGQCAQNYNRKPEVVARVNRPENHCSHCKNSNNNA